MVDTRDTRYPRYDHLMLGEVIDTADPLRIGRVRVRVPGILDPESNWAFPMGFMIGEQEGFFMVPRVGANVVVWLNQGEVDHPYYISGPFGSPGGNSDVPEQAPNGSPDVAVWRFRNFHITLDGTPGAEKMTFEDLDTGNKLELDRNTENFIREITNDEIATIGNNEQKTVVGMSTELITGPKVIAGQSTVQVTGLAGVTINGAGVSIVSTGVTSVQSTGNRTETFQGTLVRNITGTFTSIIQGVFTWTFQAVASFLGAAIRIGNGPYKRLATEDFVLSVYNTHTHPHGVGPGNTSPPTQQGAAGDMTSHLTAS